MKRLIFKGALMAALILSLTSCFSDKDYMYTDTGMCTVIGPLRIRTDTGLVYNIVENDTRSSIPDTLKRVMARCDVLRAANGKPDEYEVCLKEFMGAFVSEPVLASEAPEDIGSDGVGVTQAWISGGYLNSYVNITLLPAADGRHDLNLVYDDVRSNADSLYLEIRHNAHGECPENKDISPANLVFAGAYVSFPVDALIPAGRKPVVHLEWEWYKEDNLYSDEKVRISGNVQID